MADIAKIRLGSTDYGIKDTIARNQIITINDRIDRIDSRNFIVLGDSYGTGNQYNTGVTTSPTWVGYLQNYLGLSNDQWHTKSVDGCGFIAGYTFLQSLKDVKELLTDTESITDILIVGGYNDYTESISDIITAMSTFNNYANANFPNAKISLACVGWRVVGNPKYSIALRVWPAYRSCGIYGWKYLNGCETIMHNYRLFATDKFHPNQDGQKELGKYLADAVLTGSCNPYYGFEEAIPATINTSLFSAGSFNTISGMSNGQIINGVRDGSVTAPTPITLRNGDVYKLGTINNPYCSAGAFYPRYNSILTSVWIRYSVSGAYRFANCFGNLAFQNDDNEIFISFTPFSHGVRDNTTYDDNFPNVDIINWRNVTWLVNPDLS